MLKRFTGGQYRVYIVYTPTNCFSSLFHSHTHSRVFPYVSEYSSFRIGPILKYSNVKYKHTQREGYSEIRINAAI